MWLRWWKTSPGRSVAAVEPPGPASNPVNEYADPDAVETDIRRKADQFAAHYGPFASVTLDFSRESLGDLDAMLAEAAPAMAAAPQDDAAYFQDAAASYLLEVARREFGGVYHHYVTRDAPLLVVGLPDFFAAMLAHDKVAGRLTGDEADNIPFFYDGLVRAVERQTSAIYV